MVFATRPKPALCPRARGHGRVACVTKNGKLAYAQNPPKRSRDQPACPNLRQVLECVRPCGAFSVAHSSIKRPFRQADGPSTQNGISLYSREVSKHSPQRRVLTFQLRSAAPDSPLLSEGVFAHCAQLVRPGARRAISRPRSAQSRSGVRRPEPRGRGQGVPMGEHCPAQSRGRPAVKAFPREEDPH